MAGKGRAYLESVEKLDVCAVPIVVEAKVEECLPYCQVATGTHVPGGV